MHWLARIIASAGIDRAVSLAMSVRYAHVRDVQLDAAAARCRSVKCTADAPAEEASDYKQHGDDLQISIKDGPASFWFHSEMRKRWTVDPCEWDDDYAAGIKRIEVSMSVCPGTWYKAWILKNTTRCAMIVSTCAESVTCTSTACSSRGAVASVQQSFHIALESFALGIPVKSEAGLWLQEGAR